MVIMKTHGKPMIPLYINDTMYFIFIIKILDKSEILTLLIKLINDLILR